MKSRILTYMNRDNYLMTHIPTHRTIKMKKWIGTLAVLIWITFLFTGCETGKMPSPSPASDLPSAAQPAEKLEDAEAPSNGSSYYLFLASELAKSRGNLKDAVDFMNLAIMEDPDSLFLKKELAILYLHREENENALAVVEEIIEKDPDSVDALLLSATIRKTINKDADVRPIYEKILEKDPQRENVYQLLGKMYFSEGDMDNAFRVYEKLLVHFPDNFVAHYYLGEIHGVRGDYDQAEAAFLKALDLSPSLNEARLELIKLYRLSGQDDKIINMYAEILAQDPDNIVAAIELALFYSKKDPEKSGALLTELGTRSVDDPNVIGTVLQYLVLQKRMDDALVVLSKMADGAPESSEIAYATAIVYYEKENLAQALAQFQKIQPGSRFYENALVHMAVIYYKDNAFDEGITLLEQGMKQLPPEGRLSLIPYLSSFYKEKGMTAEAVELITAGLAIEPENKELLFDLGVIYDRQGKTDLALEQMAALLALDPDHADALNYIGYTYADQGIRLDEAEAMIKKALSLKPENGYIIDSLGWVYFRKGLLEDALFELQRAAALIPDDPVVLEHLGDIYQELNDPVTALDYYKKALEKKDEDREAIKEKIEALLEKFPEIK